MNATQRLLKDNEPDRLRGLRAAVLARPDGDIRAAVAELRSNSPLEQDAQKIVDQAVVDVGVERLTVANDLMAAGLMFNLPPDPLGVMEVQWDQMSKSGHAIRSMVPQARGEHQLIDRIHKRIPVYLTTDDFNLGVRSVMAMQRAGLPPDVTQTRQATRRVNEAIEDACLNGAQAQIAGFTAPGILNAPNANTEALTADWTGENTVGTTGPAIFNDTMRMIDECMADRKYGPFNLYVGTKAGTSFEGDFKARTSMSIKQRLEQINVGGRNLRVRIADQMPGGATGTQAALVQMTPDVIDMIYGHSPIVLPWLSEDGFTHFFLIMAIMVPRVRDDYEGNSGVCIGSKA